MIKPRVLFPVQPQGDLRTTVYTTVLERAVATIGAADARRSEFLAGGDPGYLDRVRAAIKKGFGPMPFGPTGGPLNIQPVSQFDTKHCRVENVLFDSFPGWRVNASVFVPHTPGPHRAIVIPVGHSGKQFENYQVPAQAFAALGYVAVLFDPPGQASEKQPGNDHFADGVRSFLVGLCSNRYFVLDALRCIDYLQTRNDVDLSNGVGMTGVSGGGVTTLFASVFDDRIRCLGPSCCLAKTIDHPVGDGYSTCPEFYWHSRLVDGVDGIDVLMACFPKPVMYMAGRDDEVFRCDGARRLATECTDAFATLVSRSAGGDGESRFRYFEDTCGHAYTLRQVEQFDLWMKRWLGLPDADRQAHLDDEQFTMLDYEFLKCTPPAEENMFSITRRIGAECLQKVAATQATAADTEAGVRGLVGPIHPPTSWLEAGPFQVWEQDHYEGLCSIEGFEVPFTHYRPHNNPQPCARVWVLDEGGRRRALESAGLAQNLSRMFDRGRAAVIPEIIVPDLPGWGDTTPAVSPYNVTGWGSMDRHLSYVSYGLGDGLVPMKVRCLVAMINQLESGTTAIPTILVGRGVGALVAALAAAHVGPLAGLVFVDGLASLYSLLESPTYTWPSEAFVPNALAVADLPGLVSAVVARSGAPVLAVNPRDARGALLSSTDWVGMYGPETDKPNTGIAYRGHDNERALRGDVAAFVGTVIDAHQ